MKLRLRLFQPLCALHVWGGACNDLWSPVILSRSECAVISECARRAAKLLHSLLVFTVCEDKGQSRCDSTNIAFVQVTASRWHSRVNKEHAFTERVSACKESTDASYSRFRIQLRDHRRPTDSTEQSSQLHLKVLRSKCLQTASCVSYMCTMAITPEQLLQYFS